MKRHRTINIVNFECMEIEQQVVSLELAKNLRDLGVKQVSAFHWVKPDPRSALADVPHEVWPDQEWIIELPECSAFTVAELGEMLALGNHHVMPSYNSNFDHGWYYRFFDGPFVHEQTEADARAKMLIYLLENRLAPLD